jgi:outer membrane protein OmpA-like peptidoglycan-associated protein
MAVRSTVIAAAVIGGLTLELFAQVERVSLVDRTIAAINYRQRGDTRVDLDGTALLPEARGTAEVSAGNGHTKIDARFQGLSSATRFGPEYLTYVLWAITPEGRPRNLGEVQSRGDDSTRTRVTTELQTFALIVTAEPYFAVSQPSDLVVMENVVRSDTKGKVDTVEAKYELLPRGSYLMNRPADFTTLLLQGGVPLDLAEARNALELARIAGADREAAETFGKAANLLAAAETARDERKPVEDVIMAARQSAQTAEDARLIAVKRQEDEFVAQQKSRADERERQAGEEKQRADAEAQKAAVARADVARERRDVERTRDELQEARLQTLRAQAAFAVAEQEKNELRQRLREQLNMVLETRESARGLIMMVPDVLFYSASARLTPDAREKLARVSGILAAQTELRITAEGHTDNVGNDESNQRLSEQRAQSVLAYLAQQNIPLTVVDIVGFGETRPVASNDTAQGRQQNRRVELIVSGASIGLADPSAPPQ